VKRYRRNKGEKVQAAGLRRHKSCLGQEEHSLSQDDEIRERQEKRFFARNVFGNQASIKRAAKHNRLDSSLTHIE
jgi:hypothetical protein